MTPERFLELTRGLKAVHHDLVMSLHASTDREVLAREIAANPDRPVSIYEHHPVMGSVPHEIVTDSDPL